MITQKAILSLSTGTTVIIPAVANRPVYVKKLFLTVATAGTIQFQDTNNNALTGIMNLAAATPFILYESTESASQDGWLATAPGVGVQVVFATGTVLSGQIQYIQ